MRVSRRTAQEITDDASLTWGSNPRLDRKSSPLKGLVMSRVNAFLTPSVGLIFRQPSVSTDGTLTYTPAVDANGTSDFTVTVTDDGGAGSLIGTRGAILRLLKRMGTMEKVKQA